MKNRAIAEIFYRIADILELRNEIIFKIRAYRNAASTIESMTTDIESIYNEGELENIKGLGKAIAKKIGEYIETEKLGYLAELEENIHPDLLRMLDIPSLGPKKIMALNKELGIETIDELEKAARDGKIEVLDGFGKTSQDNILKGLKIFSAARGRMLLGDALSKATDYVDYLKDRSGGDILDISITGSLRRMCETIGDIDILVAPNNEDIIPRIMETFVSYRPVKEILASGDTKSSVRFEDDTQVDLRVISRESWGAALQYFTGSRDHNIATRKIAIERGLKINEYGVFDRETTKMLAGDDEAEVYRAMGMSYVPAEAREDRGEVELAVEGDFPRLVEMEDIRGDLHIHTSWSDGAMNLHEIVGLAKERNYEYIGITDHSPTLSVAGGPDTHEILDNIGQIRNISDDHSDITLFAGSEVEILKNGELDYPDDVLEELDLVIAAVHSGFSMGEREMTTRITDALSTGHVNIMAHPTGRKIGKRDAYAMDMERVMESALRNNVALEVNSMPIRLDLNMNHILEAVNKKVLLSINTDAHKPHHLEVMKFGVAQARKGRAVKENIINTWDLEKLERFLFH